MAGKKQIRRIVLEEVNHLRADIVAGAVFPDFHREMQVGYSRLVTISIDNMLLTNELRTGVGAHWIGLVVGILAQSGGVFLHMLLGQPNQSSIGTRVTTIGAILFAAAIRILVSGLITAR